MLSPQPILGRAHPPDVHLHPGMADGTPPADGPPADGAEQSGQWDSDEELAWSMSWMAIDPPEEEWWYGVGLVQLEVLELGMELELLELGMEFIELVVLG